MSNIMLNEVNSYQILWTKIFCTFNDCTRSEGVELLLNGELSVYSSENVNEIPIINFFKFRIDNIIICIHQLIFCSLKCPKRFCLQQLFFQPSLLFKHVLVFLFFQTTVLWFWLPFLLFPLVDFLALLWEPVRIPAQILHSRNI